MTQKQITAITALLTAVGIGVAIYYGSIGIGGTSQESQGADSPNVNRVGGDVTISN